MGFLGNWSFHGRLEEEFRHVLKELPSLTVASSGSREAV
jgi:hypothetical protein